MNQLKSNFHTLYSLQSIDNQQIQALQNLGIANLGDLLAFQPFRYARFIHAAKEQLLNKDEILAYIDKSAYEKSLANILKSSPEILRGVGKETSANLQRLGMMTVYDVATFTAFAEAEEIISRALPDDADPFAPSCVRPTCKKFTRNSKNFISFFKQAEIRHLSLLKNKHESLIGNLFNFANTETKVIYLGYSVNYRQEWVFRGVHLGEPQGSVNLFMGQDTQISVLDWRRAVRATRIEDTQVAENLANTLLHQRAVDEVARATAEEHQYGATSSFGANAATSGSFVAAGAIVGGVGGGISGTLVGLALDSLSGGSDLGLGTLSGSAIGTGIGSMAGSAAGSLIYSGATTLGFVETDAEGEREIFAESAQNIQQRTVQNASSLRSFWSNIVSQNVQEEQQQIRTDRVTNYNKIHALNALYFEVLNEYQVNMRANDFTPILFLPYKPIKFTQDILRRYWWLFRTVINDEKLVPALDQHFLTLTTEPSPATEIAKLPEIDAIKSKNIVVDVNIDGSKFETLLIAVFGAGTDPLKLALAAFWKWFRENQRDNVKVKIITTEGNYSLKRTTSPNDDNNFIGRFSTSSLISISKIKSIEIKNTNQDAKYEIPGITIDLSALKFENIWADVTIKNRSDYNNALPNLANLEGNSIIPASAVNVNSDSSKKIAWDIAKRLTDQFEGVNDEIAELEEELADEALTEAKITNLLSFMNANKYGFTRLVLQNTEREQLINVLEDLKIGDVELSSIAGTSPLGFCGNHVILPLKKCVNTNNRHEPITIDVSKLRLEMTGFEMAGAAEPAALNEYLIHIQTIIETFIAKGYNKNDPTLSDIELLGRLSKLSRKLKEIITLTTPSDISGPKTGKQVVPAEVPNLFRAIAADVESLWRFVDTPVQVNPTDMSKLCGYYVDIQSSLKDRMGELLSSSEVSLPSPAVFMEPVLSNAKGAELYDMRRNSHYEILPSPGILPTDPNVGRSEDIVLTPNVPSSNLAIQNVPNYPLPNSINTALSEAGKLNLDSLINSNAESLRNTLSNLSAVATELAKASAQLTGDAQQQALGTAGDVAKQIGSILSKSLGETATAPPPPPKNQQEIGERFNLLSEIDKGDAPIPQKTEKKKAIGVPVAPNSQRNYQMSVLFVDHNGIPYSSGGDVTLSMTFHELGETFPINNGKPLEITASGYIFPDVFTLTKGRPAVIHLEAQFSGAVIPGLKAFVLPDKTDIVFKCKLMSHTRKVSATDKDVKTIVNEVIASESVGGNLEALLELFLEDVNIKFPFHIFEIDADTGGKTEVNLRAAYKKENSSTTTTTKDQGKITVSEYEIEFPNPEAGWQIDVE